MKVTSRAFLGLATLVIAWPAAVAGGPEPPADDGAAARLADRLRGHPVIRPDGTFQFRLFLLDVESGKATVIVDEPGQGHTYCGSPWWSKDGKSILFDATPMTTWSLSRLMSVELGDGPPKVKHLGMGNCPSLSPDGKRIAFLSNEEGVEKGIYVMNADGSRRTWLGSYGRPKWSPDGRQLLISSFSSPTQVSLMDLEKSETRYVAPRHRVFSIPSWADAETIVAVIGAEDADTVALLDVTDLKVKSVLWKKGDGPDVTPADPVYHAGTRRCVFVGREPKGMALYTVVAGNPAPPRRLEPERFDHTLGDLAFSPDGRFLLFNTDQWDRPSH